MSRVLEASILCAIHCIEKSAMKECILDVELMDRLVTRERVRDSTVWTVDGFTTGPKVS